MEQLIEFHAPQKERFPHPYPAMQAMPEWFRKMPAQGVGRSQQTFDTVKRCPPFIEAITHGYIIPLAEQVELTREINLSLTVKQRIPIVDFHDPVQVAGTPIEKLKLIKFNSPWLIRTPPGYSTLFIAPMNRVDSVVSILAGIIETDTYYREVNFPALVHLEPGKSCTLEKGFPIVQVIPIKREPWRSAFAEWDVEQRTLAEQEYQKNTHVYRDDHWVKKSFT